MRSLYDFINQPKPVKFEKILEEYNYSVTDRQKKRSKMYMEQGQYPLGAESVRVFISNKGSEDLGYDAYYSLEQLEGESWQEVAVNSELTIEDWAGILSLGKETSQTIDLVSYTEKLQAGNYRIVKTIDELVFYVAFELV